MTSVTCIVSSVRVRACVCGLILLHQAPVVDYRHPSSRVLAGHWLTVAQGDKSAGRDWQMILTLSDSLVSATRLVN